MGLVEREKGRDSTDDPWRHSFELDLCLGITYRWVSSAFNRPGVRPVLATAGVGCCLKSGLPGRRRSKAGSSPEEKRRGVSFGEDGRRSGSHRSQGRVGALSRTSLALPCDQDEGVIKLSGQPSKFSKLDTPKYSCLKTQRKVGRRDGGEGGRASPDHCDWSIPGQS